MQADDFIRSANVTAPLLSTELTRTAGALGKSIYQGAMATMSETGCNTNLGILLLCFPLAHAAASCETSSNIPDSLAKVLQETTVADTQFVFDAIQHMQPAGLGRSNEHDVNSTATADLLTVMHASANQDRIALQYTTNFSDVFGFGMDSLLSATSGTPLKLNDSQVDRSLAAVTTCVFMDFLAEIPDTHISRKHGATMAEAVRDEACNKRNLLKKIEHEAGKTKLLAEFDETLKFRGINPGTSADLTVAVVYAALLEAFQKTGGSSSEAISGNAPQPV